MCVFTATPLILSSRFVTCKHKSSYTNRVRDKVKMMTTKMVNVDPVAEKDVNAAK